MGDVTQYTLNRNDAQMEEHPNGAWVKHKELKAALAREAALREELAAEKKWYYQEIDEAQKHRVAAEQRNAGHLKLIAGLVEYADGLLSDVNRAWSYAGSTGAPETHKDDDYAAAVALIAKPTESGASALDPKIIGIERMPPMEYDEP